MRAAGTFLFLSISTALVLTPHAATGQEAGPDAVIVERCGTDVHRDFDFWLGKWIVRDAEGKIVGENEIVRIAGGCGLLESWRGSSGGRGTSINTYDLSRRAWTQRWVGSGSTLWLEGAMRNGRMVLASTALRPTNDGEVLDRITWTPLPDGRISQVWEVSRDDGESWTPIFQGFYEPVGED